MTRLVDLKDVRAVRVRPKSGRVYDPEAWVLWTAEELRVLLNAGKKALMAAADNIPSAYEVVISLPKEKHGQGTATKSDYTEKVQEKDGGIPVLEGVVYIPETAPVLVRTEQAMHAAEAAESARFSFRASRSG